MLVNIYGLMIQIQQAMGMQVDLKLPLKYHEALKEDKFTYISFFGSLETLQDPSIKPCIELALDYCKQMNIERLQKFRLNLEIQVIMLNIYSESMVDRAKGNENLKQLVRELQKHDNDVIEQKLVSLYYVILMLAEQSNNIDEYIGKFSQSTFLYHNNVLILYSEYAELYIKLGTKFYENVDFLSQTFQRVIVNNMINRNFEKAEKLAKDFVVFAEKTGLKTKIYVDAMLTMMDVQSHQNKSQFLFANWHNLQNLAKEAYGVDSHQYLKSVEYLAKLFTLQGKPAEEYQQLLRAYEIAKQIFGTEINQSSSNILMEMVGIKVALSLFDEAYRLIEKAKTIGKLDALRHTTMLI